MSSDLQEQLTKLREKASRLKGRRDAALEQLKSEYGCDSLEAGEAMVEQLAKETTTKRKEYEDALAKFNAEFGGKLSTYLSGK